MNIRAEAPGDVADIHRVVAAAFPSDAEARLVDELRRTGDLRVSLVASDDDGHVIGHVAFSPVTTTQGDIGIGLAPLAVNSEHRRRGIGAALVEAGLAACRNQGYAFAVVLGSPDYYARFGFEPATSHGLIDDYDGGDAFQVRPLAGAVPTNSGLVRYAPAFSSFV